MNLEDFKKLAKKKREGMGAAQQEPMKPQVQEAEIAPQAPAELPPSPPEPVSTPVNPKKETGKVQPKKETVRINLPPKPTRAPTIKLPTLPPNSPAAATGAERATAAPVHEQKRLKTVILSMDEIRKELENELKYPYVDIEGIYLKNRSDKIGIDIRAAANLDSKVFIETLLGNRGDTIAVESFHVDGDFIAKILVKSILKPKLEKFSKTLSSHLEGGEVKKIQIVNGEIVITFNESKTDTTKTEKGGLARLWDKLSPGPKTRKALQVGATATVLGGGIYYGAKKTIDSLYTHQDTPPQKVERREIVGSSTNATPVVGISPEEMKAKIAKLKAEHQANLEEDAKEDAEKEEKLRAELEAKYVEQAKQLEQQKTELEQKLKAKEEKPKTIEEKIQDRMNIIKKKLEARARGEEKGDMIITSEDQFFWNRDDKYREQVIRSGK